MQRKTMVQLHIAAAVVASITIFIFFTSSLTAEISGNLSFIMKVKACILYALPILIVSMPILKVTGDKLAGASKSPIVRMKQKRMKLIMVNGFILISLAYFLYYRSHYHRVDYIFNVAQIAEFVFGLTNLILIGLNTRDGFHLSGRLKR